MRHTGGEMAEEKTLTYHVEPYKVIADGKEQTVSRIVFDNLGKLSQDLGEAGTNLSSDIGGLILFKKGAKAETQPLNDNFVYLNTKVDALNTDFNANLSEGQVNSAINNAINNIKMKITCIGDVTGSSDELGVNGQNFEIKTTIATDNIKSEVVTALFTSLMPDWSRKKTYSGGRTNTAPCVGWLCWSRSINNGRVALLINGKTVGYARSEGSHDKTGGAAFVPIKKGDTFTCSAADESRGSIDFYPLIGLKNVEL